MQRRLQRPFIRAINMRLLMPWIVNIQFDGLECINIKKIDVFTYGLH
jgi:hypothetical protein